MVQLYADYLAGTGSGGDPTAGFLLDSACRCEGVKPSLHGPGSPSMGEEPTVSQDVVEVLPGR